MKFINYRDKTRVTNAAKGKGGDKILYKNILVMLFPDLPIEVHKQQKRFDEVKRWLRAGSIRYGMIYPACLTVTHSLIFETLADAEELMDKISRKGEATTH